MRTPGLLILASRCHLQRPRKASVLATIGVKPSGYLSPVTVATKQLRYRSHSPKYSTKTTKPRPMRNNTFVRGGVRVAVEGCGHGTLDAIYASVAVSCRARKWDGVDLVIICGDFQATRNAADLSVMSVPPKYRQLGDFPAYYRGDKTAPYLTIFISGNHEASSYLWELYYGGWVAPNIYYLGAANVLRFGPLRIAAMSGIWKGFDYRKPHHERLPFNQDDIKSFYHVREIDVRKLLLLREQVDVGLSHDWPRGIEKHGKSKALWKMKPDFKQESRDGRLGNPAAEYVMDRLRPANWFSAHLHCKYAAIKTYKAPSDEEASTDAQAAKKEETTPAAPVPAAAPAEAAANPDEIDLDMEDEDDQPLANPDNGAATVPPASNTTAGGGVSEELRAQLPASFAGPPLDQPELNPGQPVPPTITNTTTRFLALDKCLPGRGFLQLCYLLPVDTTLISAYAPSPGDKQRFCLKYDPEWLAITRVFAQYLTIGDRTGQTPPDLGEEAYRAMIDKERAWVDERVTRLDVPENFAMTAPPHRPGVDPETVDDQPEEYTNPQTAAFCKLIGVPNLWDASPEERAERRAQGPPAPASRDYHGGESRGGRGGGRGGEGRGGGSRGGRGDGRGGEGRGGGSRGGRGDRRGSEGRGGGSRGSRGGGRGGGGRGGRGGRGRGGGGGGHRGGRNR
ncbi:lariat debranching enzyme, C-terminal domain-containing protein [Hypoxylon sp. FL1857]|nr:lariat debranching enzyme, C-terminal domain-containing protein [Hypoxylon sp. FL1857]